MTSEQQVLENIRREMEALPGHLGFYYKNLVTGLEYGIRENEAFLAASVIKLPLYLHVLQRSVEGTLDMQQKLTVEDWEKMPSCGGLSQFTGPVAADIRTLCRLMIVLSDNTATNKLLRLCGLDACNAAFREMGLYKTVVRRLLFDSEAASRGLENTICPKEMGLLLERLYQKEFVSEAVCQEAVETLLKQQIDHKLDGKLCGRVPIAHKTGEDGNLSNDVGIVFAAQPFVICFAGHDTQVYPWEDLMRRATYDLVQAQEAGETFVD